MAWKQRLSRLRRPRLKGMTHDGRYTCDHSVGTIPVNAPIGRRSAGKCKTGRTSGELRRVRRPPNARISGFLRRIAGIESAWQGGRTDGGHAFWERIENYRAERLANSSLARKFLVAPRVRIHFATQSGCLGKLRLIWPKTGPAIRKRIGQEQYDAQIRARET